MLLTLPFRGMVRVKLNYPSPKSLVWVEGKVEFDGPAPAKGFWIFANSTDRDIAKGTSLFMNRGETKFRLGPMQKGRYELEVSDVAVEAVKTFVRAPAKNVVLKVKAKSKPQVLGVVVDDVTRKPIKDFRVQLRKRSTLRGPNFVQSLTWHHFKSDDGKFSVEVVGPGIYECVISSAGYSWEHRAPINTDKMKGKLIAFSLKRGFPLSGTVVNEEGEPVDGALVVPLSKAAGTMPRVTKSFVSDIGALKTENGRFAFQHLRGGKETFKITHPDYCFTVAKDIEIGESSPNARFVLKQGGTVKGHVFDEQGKPRAKATLIFHDSTGYGGSMDEEAGRLATAITNADGSYEVKHLPEQTCYVHLLKEWESQGVVRHCVVPKNRTSITLNLGGVSEVVKGQLMVDAKPLSGSRIQLTGSSAHFGLFKAYAETDDEGRFAFRGLAPGRRTLYYQSPRRRGSWVKVKSVVIPPASADLGRIEHQNGQIFVRINTHGKVPLDSASVIAATPDPVWTFGTSVGVQKRHADGGSIEFEDVPLGTHDVKLFVPNHFQVQTPVTISPKKSTIKVDLDLPVGTASLKGRVVQKEASKVSYYPFTIWSKDRRLRQSIRVQPDGTFTVKNVPAGEYAIYDQQLRAAKPIKTLKFAGGEQKEIELVYRVRRGEQGKAVLIVRPFFNQSPFPCQVTLTSAAGEVLKPRSTQYANMHFQAKPGSYTLTASHPGFREIRKAVELKVNKAGFDELDVEMKLEQ